VHGSAALDYDAVPASLAGAAVKPGDPGYGRLTSTYFRGGAPGIVLLPRTVEQVVDAVGFAGRHLHLPLGIRSGGHGLSGRSTNDGGIVVDLRHLNGIHVLDTAARLVRIGPGARWRGVAAALQPHGWALSSGDSGAVGVGGLATAGGIGLLARSHGLTIDRLVAARVVLADGSVVVADEHENRELFWAVRGAGANFGVVVAFDFEVDEVDQVGLALLTPLVQDPASFLVAFGEAAASAPRDTTAVLLAGPGDAGPLAPTIAVVVDSAEPDTIAARIQPFVELAPLMQHQVVFTPYAGVMNLHASGEQHGAGEPVGRSGLLNAITPAFAAEIAALLRSGSVHLVQLRSLGGATADVPPDATAFAHREAQFQVNALGADAREVDRHWAHIRPHLGGIYLSFETDQDPARLGEAFPPATIERLRALKRELDPRNLFRDNFNVDPGITTVAAAPATAVPG
jgi:FAD/FMN-containing dehydrogenase